MVTDDIGNQAILVTQSKSLNVLSLACVCRRKTSSQSKNQPQHLQLPRITRPNFVESDFDQHSVYDEIINLDKEMNEAHGNPYDAPDDGSFYHELSDPDKGTNETYDHPDAVPGRSTPNPYEGLNAAANTTYDLPDAVPALPYRSTHNPSQDLNQATTNPNTTPVYLELIDVDVKNETAEC